MSNYQRPNAMPLSGHEQAGTGPGGCSLAAQWSAPMAWLDIRPATVGYGDLNSPLRPLLARTPLAAARRLVEALA